MGTQVITRDTGRRLGVVGEVVVDIDRREVVALGLRDNPLTRFLPGLPRWMPLERIRQVGDVILVDSADSLSEGFTPERYSRVINCQVITESGQVLGRVLGFAFDIETGELSTLVTGALGVPLLGEGVLSTWEIPVDEVVSSGADRIIVYEGSEEKLKQLNSGFLEKLGVGGASWEEQERERYRANLVPVQNQLASGQPSEQEQRRLQGATSERLEPEEEFEYVELEDRRQDVIPQRRYLDEPPPERETGYRPYDDQRAYRDEGRYQESRPPSGYPREQRPSYQDQQEPDYRSRAGFDQSQRFEEPEPLKPRPASRRPVQRPGDPLDVEPLEQEPIASDPLEIDRRDSSPRQAAPREAPPSSAANELDDPW